MSCRERFCENFDPQMVRNTLNRAGYHGQVPRGKPFISAVNEKKRLEFAKLHINKPESFWNSVIFNDESNYSPFGSDGAQKIQRKPNKELQENNIWGCIAASGVGNLVFIDEKLDKHLFLNILKENLAQVLRETIYVPTR